MDTSKQAAMVSFEEAVLKAKVAQICDSVGYHAITQDSSNILVDIYQRTIHHLARHCKDAANNNRRVEPTLIDLIQAYDFVGISILELQEHIETVKLPLEIEIATDEQKPSNRIQRNLLVDDLLEAEKNSHFEDQDDADNKAMSESGVEEDEKPSVPLLKDTYEEIANKFSNCAPVIADKKIRLGGRILLVASTKLKISTPIPPEPVPSTSGVSGKLGKKKKKKATEDSAQSSISPKKQTKGKKKKKLSKEFILPEPTPEKEKDKDKEKDRDRDKGRGRGRGRGRGKGRGKEKGRGIKETSIRKSKVAITPLDPAIAEPPSFFPIIEEVREPVVVKTENPTPSPSPIKEVVKGKRKKRSSEEFPTAAETASPVDNKETLKTKGSGRKKIKTAITPLDPSIAEPPSFFPIIESKIEEPEIEESVRLPTPSPIKPSRGKKKKKSNNQFAIVTETVTTAAAAAAASSAEAEDKEWFCPACGGPDDGDLMVQCDSCEEWYHLGCTDLKKPPEDDENWECDICSNRAKAQKKPLTPVETTMKLKTPEPVINTPPPPQPNPPPAVASGSHDDLCPECNLPDDGTMMIQCDDPFCAKWFHGKCVSLLEEPKEDESWFCKVCVDKQQSAFKRRRRAK